MTSSEVVLEIRDLSKSFGSVRALSNVSIKFYRGEIHGVLGQNGAGKSTLVKLLTGSHATSSATGQIFLNGKEIKLQNIADGLSQGIGYVPQEIEIVGNLSVAENIFAGRLPGKFKGFSKSRTISLTKELLKRYELDLPVEEQAGTLSAAQRQLTMIARALAFNPSILLLDEPTTSLSTEDAQNLSETLSSLRTKGVTIIYITHRLKDSVDVCDQITVMKDGQVAANLTHDSIKVDEIITAMLGRSISRSESQVSAKSEGRKVLEVENLSASAQGPQSIAIHNISFDLFEGEVLGIAGLVGSGRTELLSAVAGRIPSLGEIRINGVNLEKRTPKLMRENGIHLLSEDRKKEGLLFNLNLVENVTAGSIETIASWKLIQKNKEIARATELMRDLFLKTSSYQANPSELSGGNQQKLLFARMLVQSPPILLLDEPTKGVDVGARQEIYKIIWELKSLKKSIIIVSSDLEELLYISERFIVLSEGEKVDEFDAEGGSEERILKASAGVHRSS